MALRGIEGFEIYGKTDDIGARSGFIQWRYVGGYSTLGIGKGRGGGNALEIVSLAGARGAQISFGEPMQVGFIGFAVRLPSDSYGAGSLVFTGHDTTQPDPPADVHTYTQFTVRLNGVDGSISYPGGRTVNNILPANTWAHVQIGWRCARDGTGRIQIKINDVLVVNAAAELMNPGATASYVSFPPSSNAFINGVGFANQDNLFGLLIDDIWVCDGTAGPGSLPCNTFLGDRKIVGLVPNSNAVVQWAPGGNAAVGENWQELTTTDGDATYNTTGTVGAEDLFTLTALPSNVVQVIAVQIAGSYKKMDASMHTITQRLNSGGVEAIGIPPLGVYSLSTDYQTYTDLFAVDPRTNASWTLPALAPGVIKIGYALES